MPDDPTPLGDAMTHRFNEQKIPQPKEDRRERDSDNKLDIERRPPLPERRQPGAADGGRPPSRERGVTR